MKPIVNRPIWVLWTWALFFIGAVWLLGFPQPMVDDLYYAGAGMNLASGGDFSNPFLARVYYPSHYFFVYPPLHSYLIFGWLKTMGISAASLTGFVALMYLLTTCATLALLRRYGAPNWLAWFVPVGVCAAMLPAGLRPEPPAVGLIMLGFAICECGAVNALSLFLGFLLLFLGGSAAPRMTPFAAVLVVFAAFHRGRELALQSRRSTCHVLLLGAFLVAALSFLLMIHFRVSEFWQTFHFNTVKLVGGSKLELLKYFWKTIIITGSVWPLLLLASGFFLLALRKPMDEPTGLAIFIVCGFVLAALLGGLTFGASWWLALILFLTAGKVMKQMRHYRLCSAWLALALLAAFLLPSYKLAIQAVGILTGKIQIADLGQKAEALALRPTQDHALLVDHFAARYVFDYRMPAGTIDWGTATLFIGPYFDTRLWKRGDVFVVTSPSVTHLLHYTFLEAVAPPLWAAPWRAQSTVFRYPRHASVIPAVQCRGVRPEFLPPDSPKQLEWVSGADAAKQ